MERYPGFEESVGSFQQFLAANRYPPCIVWLREQDVVLGPKRTLYVRDPLLLGNEEEARAKFSAGMRSHLGVLFAALCTLGDVTGCYVWTPLDENEAQYRLMAPGIKFSLPIGASRTTGRAVKNGLVWQWLEWRHRKRHEHKSWLFQ